ncbi:MAG: UDP-N-acetylglucosamine--N-acetylmuramyl-(pentapeptide) pyrophosphoryl-undecaprenol N-acetylglucosamine transferase [Anaerolineae bacterium]
MRIMISGGGTGGGVYPAIAIIKALQARHPDAAITWLGSRYGIEAGIIEREAIPFTALPGGPLVGVGLRAIPNALRILAAVVQAWRIAGQFRPDALLITGGWPTIAPTLACWLRRIPIMIYLPDLEPAGTIRALGRLARVVAVNTPESAAYFRPGQAVVTGYPLRPPLLAAAGYDALGQPTGKREAMREVARRHFNLTPGLPTLLVFGGSRGARSINTALIHILPDLLAIAQVIHVSGTLDAEPVRAAADALPADRRERYHLFDYLHTEDMALALATADLVVARAGAGTLGEFPIFELPAILVPYPHAWRYQKTNADYLASRGAAVRLDDDRLMDELGPLVHRLLTDREERERMAQAAAALKGPDAAARAADILAGLVRTP